MINLASIKILPHESAKSFEYPILDRSAKELYQGAAHQTSCLVSSKLHLYQLYLYQLYLLYQLHIYPNQLYTNLARCARELYLGAPHPTPRSRIHQLYLFQLYLLYQLYMYPNQLYTNLDRCASPNLLFPTLSLYFS